MYITIADGGGVSGRVDYPDMNEIREEWWHEWIIELQEFVDDNSVDLSNVSQITIGFGVDDGIDPGNSPAGDGIVYFDDIWLYEEYPPAVKHMVKVPYNSSQYSLMSEWWHVWNIPFAEINDINLANVTQIAIGFGDGKPPYVTTGEGTVYFDEIILGHGPAEGPFYDGAVELDEDPFVFGYYWYPLFLKPGCRLIDAGAGYIDGFPYLIGKASCVYVVPDTNNLHGVPDTNVVNIGCHYFDWHYSNAGGDGNLFPADLNGDKIANLKDFAVLAGYWRQSTLEKNDIDRSGFVDYNDLEILAYQWLRTQSVFPDIVPSFDEGPNDLSGYVQMSIDAPDPNIYRVFALIDGKPHREFFIETEEDPYIGIHTERFANGPHAIKIVSTDMYGNVICSEVNEVIFNNDLSSVTMSECYELNKPYCLYAFGSPGDSYVVDVNDDFNDTVVYSGNFTGDINAVVPAEAFAADDLIYGLKVSNSSNPEGTVIYDMASKKVEYNSNSPVRMIVSVGSEFASTYCREVIEAVINAGNIRVGKDHVIPLRFGASSWDNVKRHLQLPDVKIWVHVCHGSPSGIEFNDGVVYAFRGWHFWRDNALTDLGFQEDPKLNFVFFHGCQTAATTQFAEALGIWPIVDYYEEGVGERAFIGWATDVVYRDTFSILFRSYNTLTKEIWSFLGSGQTLYKAKEEAEKEVRRNPELEKDLSVNLRDCGVSDVGNGDQHIYLSYPGINSPSGW